MTAIDPRLTEYRLVRGYVLVLLASWLAGTVLVMAANAVAPTTPPTPITSAYLGLLRSSSGWYAAGYALFFVADVAVALLGAVLVSWLQPASGFRRQAMVILFALSGMLGILADMRMLGAAQTFRLGSPLLALERAPAFFDELNTACNWLSAASFLPAGVATWLAGTAARSAGVRGGWILLTRFGALYQVAVGLLSAMAFLTQHAAINDLAVIGAIFGLPLFAAVWFVWMLWEMKQPVHTARL